MGPFGVIPKPFRMESPFRMEGHFDWKAIPIRKPRKTAQDIGYVKERFPEVAQNPRKFQNSTGKNKSKHMYLLSLCGASYWPSEISY